MKKIEINDEIVNNFKKSFEAIENLEFENNTSKAIAVIREYFTAYGKEDFTAIKDLVKDKINIDFDENIIDLLEKSVDLEINEGITFVRNLSLEQIKDIVQDHFLKEKSGNLNSNVFDKLNESLSEFLGADNKADSKKVKQHIAQI